MGDQRPIEREIDHAILGKLEYSDDNEAWLTDPNHNDIGFKIMIDGDWGDSAETISPALSLTEWAEEIFVNSKDFLAELKIFIETQKSEEYKDFSDEIDALEIDFITLGPEKCPGEGSVYYKDTTEDRCWYCDYQKRNPVVLGFDR